MPRYPAANLAAVSRGLHARDAATERQPAQRIYEDAARLQRLYTIGVVLQEWTLRFDTFSKQALTASISSADSLKLFLTQIASTLVEAAPAASTPEAQGRRAADLRELDETIFLAEELPGYVDESFNFTWEPSGPFADGTVPPDAMLNREWLPPEQPPLSDVRFGLKAPLAAARSIADWGEFQAFTRRTARLATDAVANLVAHLESTEEGGFSRSRVDEAMASPETTPAARRLNTDFQAIVGELVRLGGRNDPGQWAEWAALTERLFSLYGAWISDCYGSLLTGDAGRSKRQTKKNTLRRLVAVVRQYGTLMCGAERVPRVAAALQCLETIGRQLQKRVKKVLPGAREPDADEIQRRIRLWDELLVTQQDRERWTSCLGASARQGGRIAQLIAGFEGAQDEPWAPGEHMERLVESGIFGRRNHDKEFTEIRIRMQEAGIAVQGPWEFIEGRASTPEKKSGVADKWLINPLAQILAPTTD